MNPLPNVIAEPFQGKHGALSSSRMSSQAPNGPPSARLSSCCNSGFMLSCKHFFDHHHHLHCPHLKIKALTRLFILCDQFWNLVKLFATPSTTPALFGGGMLGYVMYDITHYYLHHAQPTRAVTKNLKVKTKPTLSSLLYPALTE